MFSLNLKKNYVWFLLIGYYLLNKYVMCFWEFCPRNSYFWYLIFTNSYWFTGNKNVCLRLIFISVYTLLNFSNKFILFVLWYYILTFSLLSTRKYIKREVTALSNEVTTQEEQDYIIYIYNCFSLTCSVLLIIRRISISNTWFDKLDTLAITIIKLYIFNVVFHYS